MTVSASKRLSLAICLALICCASCTAPVKPRPILRKPHIAAALVGRTNRIVKPFYLAFDTDTSCRPFGFTLQYWDDKGRTNWIGFPPASPLLVFNLFPTNKYWFAFTDVCNPALYDDQLKVIQWRPLITNVVSLWVTGGQPLMLTNPPSPRFWRLLKTSPTSADVLASSDLTLRPDLWSKDGQINYPVNFAPRLLISKTSNWDGIEAYEHPQ